MVAAAPHVNIIDRITDALVAAGCYCGGGDGWDIPSRSWHHNKHHSSLDGIEFPMSDGRDAFAVDPGRLMGIVEGLFRTPPSMGGPQVDSRAVWTVNGCWIMVGADFVVVAW